MVIEAVINIAQWRSDWDTASSGLQEMPDFVGFP
jgi:hypothetical protein